MKNDRQAPPEHLKPGGRALWQSVCESFDLEAFHLRILECGCTAWDRMTGARKVIDDFGATLDDRFGFPRARPEVKIEESSRTAVLRALRELGLSGDDIEDVRPPEIQLTKKVS